MSRVKAAGIYPGGELSVSRMRKAMLRGLKYAAVFISGGLIYASLEISARGYTHWTMIVAGGICSVFLYLIAVKSREKTWRKWIMGAAVITTIELLTGIVVNIMLGWEVWNYSDRWANLCGQICVLFTFFWFLLSIPGVWLMRRIGWYVFKEGRSDSRNKLN